MHELECFEVYKVCCKMRGCGMCFLEDVDASKCNKMYDMEHQNMLVKRIERQLPKECKGCSFLQIINPEKEKIYCPYRIKDKCIIKP